MTTPHKTPPRKPSKWPLWLIGSPAAVAVWSGWVGLGEKTGFGPVHLFPGIWSSFVVNTAIALPIGVEAYGAYALGVWLHPKTPKSARKFAKRSAFGALGLGMLGQIAYHLLAAAHQVSAPWWITMLVSCLPVVTIGLASGLHHMRSVEDEQPAPVSAPEPFWTTMTPDQVQGTITTDGPAAGPSIETLQRIQANLPTVISPRPQMPEPEPAPAQSLAELVERAGPQPTFTPSPDGPAGTVTVRSPLSRLDHKVPYDQRGTGTFPAIRETAGIPAVSE